MSAVATGVVCLGAAGEAGPEEPQEPHAQKRRLAEAVSVVSPQRPTHGLFPPTSGTRTWT
jgi:hypothetical protein